MNNKFQTIIIILSVICLSACTSTDRRLKKEFDKIRSGPSGSPYKSITSFSGALQCMDNLMVRKNIKNIPILIEAIDDKTEAVNAGTRDMLISAISEMTIQSHGVKVIAYGQDSANLISYMKKSSNNKAFKQKPMFDIHGSISQHDENLIKTGSSLGLFLRKEGGSGQASSASISVIALDLNVLDARDMAVVPGVTARNSISILKRGKSFDADASINKLGIYYDISLNRTEGKTQALRTLVELSAIELVGKLVKIPYWSCLGAKKSQVRHTLTHNLQPQPTQMTNQIAHKDTVTHTQPASMPSTTHKSVRVMKAGLSTTTHKASEIVIKQTSHHPKTVHKFINNKGVFESDGIFKLKKIHSEVVSVKIIGE